MANRNRRFRQWVRVSWRNISRQRKRTVLLAGAVGFAVLIITLVNGYTAGLISAVRENFTQTLGGHVYVSGSVIGGSGREMKVLQDTQTLDEAIAAARIDVEEVNYRSSTVATLIYTTSEVTQIVDGVDFAAEARFRRTIRLAEGSWEELEQPGSILLPTSVAEQLRVALGERILLSFTTITGQRNVIELTVRGLTADVAGLGLSSGYVQLGDLNSALGLRPGEYQSANLYLADSGEIDGATERLLAELSSRASVAGGDSEEEDLPGGPMRMMQRLLGVGGGGEVAEPWAGTRFEVSNLNDTTEELATIIDTLNLVAFGIFLVLLVITAVGITNSYRMVMLERTQEIGTMRSIGVTRAGVRWIFTLEALFVALIGAAAGTVAALVVAGGVSLVEWDASNAISAFLLGGRLYADLSIAAVTRNVIVIFVMTAWAVNSPARAAARLEPAQALRTTY